MQLTGMTHNTLHASRGKSSHQEGGRHQDHIIFECRLVDSLQKQVNRCSSRLKTFELRLEREW